MLIWFRWLLAIVIVCATAALLLGIDVTGAGTAGHRVLALCTLVLFVIAVALGRNDRVDFFTDPGTEDVDLATLLYDRNPRVVEKAAKALGDRGEEVAVFAGELARVATEHPDAGCREAAVTALDAIGDIAGLPAIIRATEDDEPAVRLKGVNALHRFEGPEVEAAIERAKHDADWDVRNAARRLS